MLVSVQFVVYTADEGLRGLSLTVPMLCPCNASLTPQLLDQHSNDPLQDSTQSYTWIVPIQTVHLNLACT